MKALIVAEVLFAPRFVERPIRSAPKRYPLSMSSGGKKHPIPTRKEWRKELTGKKAGNRWVPYRGGRDRLEIHVDATTGRLQDVIAID